MKACALAPSLQLIYGALQHANAIPTARKECDRPLQKWEIDGYSRRCRLGDERT
jgi:hypothetical protein